MKNTCSTYQNQGLVGIFCIMMSAVGFGTTGILSLVLKRSGLSVWDSLAIRYVGSALVLLPFLFVGKPSIKIPQGILPKIIFNAVITFGSTGTLLFLSYQTTTTAIATTLHFLYPLIVIFLSVLTGTEKINFKIITLGLFSLVGLVLIAEPWKNFTTGLIGPLLALLSAFTFSLYVMFLNNTEVKKVDNIIIIFLMFFFAGIASTTVALIIRICNPTTTTITIRHAIPATFCMIIFSTVLPVFLFSIGNRKIGGSTSSMLSMLEPMTAILLGITILGEHISWTFAIGAPIILFSAYAISKITIRK